MTVSKLKDYGVLIGVGVLCIFCFLAGWTVNGWRLDGKTARADADRATQAVADLVAAAAIVKTAADDHLSDVSPLRTSIADLKKELKNAKPLPADCRPDAVRMQGLRSAVRAANAAAAGQEPGATVPAD